MSEKLTDIPFEEAKNVSAIQYRLHPLDVGFNVRAERVAVAIDSAATTLRVSYADRKGERRVMEGPRDAVVSSLRKLGYVIKLEGKMG